jgi:hypothetical protein
MKRFAEDLGYRMVSRFLPNVTAAASICACDPGSWYCKPGLLKCTCLSDCKTIRCTASRDCRPG